MTPSRVALEILQNKANLATLLQSLGVPMPNTLPVNGSADVSELPPSDGTFYFLKPRDSQSFLGRFGTKGIRLSTADEARKWLDVITSAHMSVVLQEYIPGSATEHFFIDGYADRTASSRRCSHAVASGSIRPISATAHPWSASPCRMSTARSTAFIACWRRRTIAASFRSSSNVIRATERSSFSKSTRPWWFVDFAVRCGVDVCRMAYDDAQGCEVHALETYSVGATCIFPYYDFFAMRRLVAARQTSWWRWLVEITRALQPVGCPDDPMPAIVGTARSEKALRSRLTGGAA